MQERPGISQESLVQESLVQESFVTTGLKQPAEIAVDRWGVPHIRAESLDDLFFAQGFNAARDRLWQIDLWRKRGLGLLAEDFGPGFLMQDRAARLFLYRGDMEREWDAYGCPDMRAICEAFTAGINAYVALTEREPERLPPEFAALGTRPARWAAQDVVRIRSHGLTRNAISEILRAIILSRTDAATDALRSHLDPPAVASLAEGLDLAGIGVEAIDVFKLAIAGVTFTKERLGASLAEAERWSKVNELGEVVEDLAATGSNNWVIHGSRTASGRPILANDPHRAHAVPSLRYLVHLSAPGFDAVGAGEPAVPGISIGHNGTIAFGLTIFCADQEDVYVYETQAGAPDRYRYEGGFEAMQVVDEVIAVKGAPDQKLTLKFSRHGPIIHEDAARRRAIAVKSVWFAPGAGAYLASLAAMRAPNFMQFREAVSHWGAPSINMIYADVEGNVAWMPAGKMPKRPNWNGLLPVPGDGSHEWDGFVPQDELPVRFNPPEGFVATANEMNLPADWPHARVPIGHEWSERSRTTRIHEVLQAKSGDTVASSQALQTDVVSMPARRLTRLLARLPRLDGDAALGRALLEGWNCALDADSAAAALFEVWWMRHLRPALLARLSPDAALAKLLLPGDIDGLLHVLEVPDGRFGADPLAQRDALLRETLAAAVAECRRRLGDDPATWRWGALHHGFFEHALSNLALPSMPASDVGPLPKGGSGSTPMHTGYRQSDFRVTHGASVRLVIDVGEWDNSVCMNSPGQSGDPRSQHYRDLAPGWARGDYVPLLYSRARIEPEIVARIALLPES
ncbi:penicillin amidase [Rhizobiales bacterium GAS188]|nr:penicillin amidase [Rhizobiales bacterium GAS188]